MASIILFSILAMTMITVYGQRYSNANNYGLKPGSCPPPLPINVCTKGCTWDNHCLGISKCCPTSCGGSICSRPVTTRKPTPDRIEKPGVCPDSSTGRWICSSTCIDDSDCTETRKCCKTSCGGFICKKPQIPEVEVAPKPSNDVDAHSNNIPYDNSNVEPVYHANRENPFLFNRPH